MVSSILVEVSSARTDSAKPSELSKIDGRYELVKGRIEGKSPLYNWTELREFVEKSGCSGDVFWAKSLQLRG